MGMSAAHCQGNVMEFQTVWRVVTVQSAATSEIVKRFCSWVCQEPDLCLYSLCGTVLLMCMSVAGTRAVQRRARQHTQWTRTRLRSIVSRSTRTPSLSLLQALPTRCVYSPGWLALSSF